MEERSFSSFHVYVVCMHVCMYRCVGSHVRDFPAGSLTKARIHAYGFSSLTLGRLSNLPSTGMTTQLLCPVGIYVHFRDRKLGLHIASTLTPLSRTGSEIFVFLLFFQGVGVDFWFLPPLAGSGSKVLMS